MKFLKKVWWLLPVLVIAAASFGAWRILQSSHNEQAVECLGANENEFKCWEQRYDTIVMVSSPEEAFLDVRKAYDTVPFVKKDCHQISHVIGRAAARKYGDIVKAYNEGDNFCWSGYYHGVLEGVASEMGADGFIAGVATTCEGAKAERAYSFYHYNCVHGLGHGLMAVLGNELFESLENCDRFNDSWEQESCYGGVFMENVMSDTNPDHHTDYIKRNDPLYPCTAVGEKYKNQCYLMQTSHALTVVGQDYAKVFELCATVGEAYEATCYQSLGRDASGSTSSDIERTRALCLQGPDKSSQANCFIGAVKDFLSYHHDNVQGLALCASLEDDYLRTACKNAADVYYTTF